MSETISNRRRWVVLAAAVAVVAVWWWGNDAIRAVQGARTSVSSGSASNGSVEDSVRLPSSGPNFETYSRLGSLIGRTSVNDRVHDSVVEAYEALGATHPEIDWVYGETGWPEGGEFWPHRTHQNGLVVDFMVPVRVPGGAAASLPTSPWHGFGYRLEFDDEGLVEGRGEGLEIDLGAVAAHLTELDSSARRNGLRIRRVIFAPALRKRMLAQHGTRDLRKLPFSKRPVWVRHDDHYHVEFELR